MIKLTISKILFAVTASMTLFSLPVAAATPQTKVTGEINVTGAVPLKLYIFDCGNVKTRDVSLFNPLLEKGTQKDLADPCYLIKHPKGTLVWDTGVPDQLIENKNGLEIMDGAFNFSVSKTLRSQLAEISVDPSKIDFLAFSHLHNDHTGNAGLFKNSTWLMQEAEYTIAFSENAKNYGYLPQDYSNKRGNTIIKLHGNHDVFGDGAVVIISTPGHSPGHQSLFVDLPKTGPIILSGDLYHFKENRDNYGIPVWNSKKETIHSFALIDTLLERSKASLWIQHDKEQFDTLRHAPQFYQ